MTSILNDREKIRQACELESTMAALRFLGLRAAGGNYVGFKRACEKFGFPQPISSGGNQTSKARAQWIIPLDQILVENSSYSNRRMIKKRCFEAGLLENRCYGKGCPVQVPVWNGAAITLQLEHKNGVHNDHRIENLEILCPNCHSQTKTFAGRSSSN